MDPRILVFRAREQGFQVYDLETNDLSKIDKIALGPWNNTQRFWVALVEKKQLPHLGNRLSPSSPLYHAKRNQLALGDVVFPALPNIMKDPDGFVLYVTEKTRDFLKSGWIKG